MSVSFQEEDIYNRLSPPPFCYSILDESIVRKDMVESHREGVNDKGEHALFRSSNNHLHTNQELDHDPKDPDPLLVGRRSKDESNNSRLART